MRVRGNSPRRQWNHCADKRPHSCDTNLRCIRSLNIFGQARYRDVEYCVMVRYRNKDRKKQAVLTSVDPVVSKPMDHGPHGIQLSLMPSDTAPLELLRSYRKKRVQIRTAVEELLQPHIDVLKADGPHVRVLECVVGDLEPSDTVYLRDDSALEGPKGSGSLSFDVPDTANDDDENLAEEIVP